MDVSLDQLVLILAAIGGLGAVIQHFGDRYLHNGLYKRTLRVAEGAPQKIASAVETALNASLDRQRALAQAEMDAAMKAQLEAADGQLKGAEMSMVRAVGVDKQLRSKVDRLLGDAILGPAMPLLRQFAPGLADALEENPQLLDVVVQNPLFKKYVAPRLEQYLGGQTSQPSQATGWGT